MFGNSTCNLNYKSKKINLYFILQLYILQLKLDDVSNPLALIAEQQQQEQQENEGEPKVVKKTEPELIAMILSSLLQLLKEDKLAGMLSIRKGKVCILFLNVKLFNFILV